MNRNSGETSLECVVRTKALFPNVYRLLRRFDAQSLFNNDRALQNFRMLGKSRADRDGVKKIPMAKLDCDMHDSQTGQSHQFDAKALAVSNTLHVGLLNRQAGALSYVRRAVRCCLLARLVIVKCANPPCDSSPHIQERDAILKLFIGARYGVAGQVRIFILKRMLNSPWSAKRVIHYCVPGCCSDRHTKKIIADEVVDALIPRACPLLQRGKWLDADEAIDWCGLIANCHNLFADIMPVVCEHLDNPDAKIIEDCFALVSDSDNDDDDYDGDLVPADIPVDPDPLADAQLHDGDSSIPVMPDGSVDWAKYSQRTRGRVRVFSRSSAPGTDLVILRRAMESTKKFQQNILWMSSEDYVYNNIRRLQSGLSGRQQLVDCATGMVTKKYWMAIDELLFGEHTWDALTESQKTHGAKTDAFKVSTKGVASVFILLDCRHRRFPSLLYKILEADAAAVASIQESAKVACVVEPFTAEHMEQVEQDMSGQKSQMLLQSNATVGCNQINWVERGHQVLHAIGHNCLTAKKPSCETFSRDLCLQRHHEQERGAFAEPAIRLTKRAFDEVERKRKQSQKPRAIRRRAKREQVGLPFGRRGISTSWNRFTAGSEAYKQNRRSSVVPTTMAEIAADYRGTSAAAKVALRPEARVRTHALQAKRWLRLNRHSLQEAEDESDGCNNIDAAELVKAMRVCSNDYSMHLRKLLGILRSADKRDQQQRDARNKRRRLEGRRWLRSSDVEPGSHHSEWMNGLTERSPQRRNLRVFINSAAKSGQDGGVCK